MHQKNTVTLTTKHIWAIAVGMVISGQFFGWNYGFQVAGIHGMFIASGIVTLFYLFFMLSYAELAAMIPKAGGPCAYAERAFGRAGGFAAGMMCLVEFVFAPPAIAVATGAYIHFLFPAIPAQMAGVSVFALCLFINLSGTKDVALFELTVTLLAIIALIIYYISTLHSMPVTTAHSTTSVPTQHWTAAIPYAIWLYLAIEGVAMTAEDVKQPHKHIPRGFISAIVTVAICSLLTLYLTATHSPTPRAAIDYPLSYTLGSLYGTHSWLARTVDLLGLFGLVASLNGITLGYSKQMAALADKYYLPRFLSRRTRRDVPFWALFLPGLFGLACVYSSHIANTLIIVATFGAMCMYCMILASLFRLRRCEPQALRPYHVWYPWIPATAFLLGLLCLGCLTAYAIIPNQLVFLTIHISLNSIILAIAVVSVVSFYLKKKRLNRHQNQ